VRRKRNAANYRSYNKNLDISSKANRVLNIILLAIVLIIVRCWHLSVVQYDDRLQFARRPQQRSIIEPAKRATIRDRFNIPLAINKVQYQAGILYSHIRDIPAISWQKDPETGKKIKTYQRREYIKLLAQRLAKELHLDAERLVDLIHSKASLYGHIPYVIKEEITEQEYYRLKMLEKNWHGIAAIRSPKRHYPQGKVAAELIGYMGAINRGEYEGIMGEVRNLEEYLTLVEQGIDAPEPEGMNSHLEVKARLQDLKEKAYNINDHVGKSGIEGQFEEELRGFHGKKSYFSDARGNFLRELPGGRDPLSGKRLLLTISSELQEYAEELLIKNEQIRHSRVSGLKSKRVPKEPWIKGGAIIVMDPNNGEVLAMASTPRYDPNDFVSCGNPEKKKEKNKRIKCWFETEGYLAGVWDQKFGLHREIFDAKYGVIEEEHSLDWNAYLQAVLPPDSPIIASMKRYSSVEDAIIVQRTVEILTQLLEPENIYHLINSLYTDDQGHEIYGNRIGAVAKDRLQQNIHNHQTVVKRYKQTLDKYLNRTPLNYDKVLFIDLYRLAVREDLFSEELLHITGEQTLSQYRNASAAMARLSEVVKEMCRELFHELDFKQWRNDNEKSYLKGKRLLEKEQKRYAKPYLDYIDKKEKELFQTFWARYRWQFLIVFLTGEWMDFHPDENINPYLAYFLQWHQELEQGAHNSLHWVEAYHHLRTALVSYDLDIAIEYFQTLRSFNELERPLLGRYRHLRKENGIQLEKHLAAGFYPKYGYGFARSHAYRQATTLGSIFKVVTAYEALTQQYKRLDNPYVSLQRLNPLTIQDQYYKVGKDEFVGYHEGGKPIPRYYKGGRLPRSLSRNIGKLDISTAMERSSNPYFALLAGDFMDDCCDLEKAARLFSYGEKTGIKLPLEIKGKVPDDLAENRTGLYSFSIGQHSLVVTPLQTAVMLSTIANGGYVVEPKIVHLTVGRVPNRDDEITLCKPPFSYQQCYSSVGIDFPLYTAAMEKTRKSIIQRYPTKVTREIFMPEQVRRVLIEGMGRVVQRSQQVAIGSLQNLYRSDPNAIKDLLSLKGQLVGKTSTAESVENIDLDLELGTNKYNHLWFGGIAFHDDKDQENTYVFKDKFGQPELVVVVYLRYGAYGKDTMPVAAQVVNKWREIKNKNTR
jgi:cell division protein FtsI/penicillin-binding protein 2